MYASDQKKAIEDYLEKDGGQSPCHVDAFVQGYVNDPDLGDRWVIIHFDYKDAEA